MEVESGSPHEALFFVLSYLPLLELLSMTQVCKSFRDAIRDDVLVWLNIVVEKPLSFRFTDKILINITSKAHGKLRSLALLNCVKITDEGLLTVVNANPLLTKLYVPDCSSLTPDGILMAVKALTTKPTTNLTAVKISGIYNLKEEHYRILLSCLPQTTERKPRFYHKYRSSSFRLIDEDSRAIDMEICQTCREVQLVFDCPNETKFRGCFQCILWCVVCGKCISDKDNYEHGICNDIICPECYFHLPKCNHCNEPYCLQHADKKLIQPGSQGFVCEVCIAKSAGLVPE